MKIVTITHRFAASAERVFDAWLDPAKVRRFLYTTATGDIVRCELDARVGGHYAIVDRRDGIEILHEGSYLEIDRPRRLVFTLRVPMYSPDADRITLEIVPLEHGCELTLTTEVDEAWAADATLGWRMLLDVLDEILPGEHTTCGHALAQRAGVPRRIAVYLAELAETLQRHQALLVGAGEATLAERETYHRLTLNLREAAAWVDGIALDLAAQRDQPPGEHDPTRAGTEVQAAFTRFAHEQGALASVVRAAAARDEHVLAAMRVSQSTGG